MDSLPVFCSGGASLLVLSVSYERDEAECWANVANIVLRVQPGRLEQSVALSHRLDILSRRLVSHLPDSTRDRQSTRDIFSVITTSLGLTSRISLVQLISGMETVMRSLCLKRLLAHFELLPVHPEWSEERVVGGPHLGLRGAAVEAGESEA